MLREGETPAVCRQQKKRLTRTKIAHRVGQVGLRRLLSF